MASPRHPLAVRDFRFYWVARFTTTVAQMSIPTVAVTGIGVVSPYGVGREVFWQHVKHGRSGTRTITEFDATPYGCTVAAPVPPVSIDDAIPIKSSRLPGERVGRVGVDGSQERLGFDDVAVLVAHG